MSSAIFSPLFLRARGWIFLVVTMSVLSGAASVEAREPDWILVDSIGLEKYLPKRTAEKFQSVPENRGLTPEDASVEKVKVKIYRQQGEGSFPAIIYLHGCGGYTSGYFKPWREMFSSLGYVAVVVDSWATRRISSVCDRKDLAFYVMARVGDVYGVLNYIIENREKYKVDPGRVVLFGNSNGAFVTHLSLQVRTFRRIRKFVKPGAKLAGGIALYPHCTGKRPTFYNPLTIIIGEEDNWTLPEKCRKWVDSPTSPKSAPLDVHFLPDATHGFDNVEQSSAPRYVLGKYLMYYNLRAHVKAEKIVKDFLAKLGHGRGLGGSQTFALASEIEEALVGNTLQFTTPKGGVAFQYFEAEGRAARMFADQPGLVISIEWRTDEAGRLCRRRTQQSRETCVHVTIDGGTLTAYRPNGQVGGTASILEGDQLPR